MATCVIHLENYQGQYYPGNTIIAKVICSFTKPLNIRGVRVTLQGREHVEWTKTEGCHDKGSDKPNFRTVHYSGNNDVLKVVTTLAGEGNYSAGHYEYPFSFNLPKNLPATFEGKNGWIRYEIKGSVVIPFGFDHQDVKQLKVVAPVDLNEIPGIQMTPVTYTVEKNVMWFFRSCGLITMKVDLEKDGFAQGEPINMKLEVSNMSTENITKVEVKMGMVIESNVTCPSKETKSDYQELAIASDTGVGAHGQRAYTFDLMVPQSVVVPNFTACKLYSQSAKIDITAVVKGMHSNLDLSAPIYLGNIPFSSQNTFPNMHFQQSSYPVSSHAPHQTVPYSSAGAPPYSMYPSTAAQPSTFPRQPPPTYSQFPEHTNSPSQFCPVMPPPMPTPAQNYTPKPGPSTVSQVPPKESFVPSAPKEELDDDFVLL